MMSRFISGQVLGQPHQGENQNKQGGENDYLFDCLSVYESLFCLFCDNTTMNYIQKKKKLN